MIDKEVSKRKEQALKGRTITGAMQFLMDNPDNDGDCEVDHKVADELLSDLLIEQGFTEIVEFYNQIPKWYA